MADYNSNIWKMYVLEIFQNLHFFSGVLVPFFTVWGGISFSKIMILQAIFAVSIFLFEVPTGAIADRFGRKISLFLSGIIGCIAALIYISYPNFWIFALGEVLFGIGVTLSSGADQALLYDSLKQVKKEKQSKRIFGRWSTMSLIAMMVAAPIGSVIAKYFGLTAPMLITSIPFLCMALWALTLKEPPVKMQDESKDYWKIFFSGLKYFKEHKILRILAFDFIFIQIIAFIIIWLYQVVLKSFDFNIAGYGFVHAGIVLGEIIILNSFVHLEKIFRGKKRYLLFTSFIVGISYLVIAFASDVYIAIMGIILAGAFGITRNVLFQSYFNKFINSENRATVLSTISMMAWLVASVFNIAVGYMVDWNLKYSLIMLGISALILTFISRVDESHLRD